MAEENPVPVFVKFLQEIDDVIHGYRSPYFTTQVDIPDLRRDLLPISFCRHTASLDEEGKRLFGLSGLIVGTDAFLVYTVRFRDYFHYAGAETASAEEKELLLWGLAARIVWEKVQWQQELRVQALQVDVHPDTLLLTPDDLHEVLAQRLPATRDSLKRWYDETFTQNWARSQDYYRYLAFVDVPPEGLECEDIARWKCRRISVECGLVSGLSSDLARQHGYGESTSFLQRCAEISWSRATEGPDTPRT